MLRQINDGQLQLRRGNLIESQTEAIVTAANSALLGGGGVDGAVHAAAGPELLEYLQSQYPQGCPTGQAVLSPGFLLPQKSVIHAVGPIWKGGIANEKQLLAQAYFSALHLATSQQFSSIAFPAISAGAYGMPLDIAAQIAIATTLQFLKRNDLPQRLEFVLWTPTDYAAFSRALESATSSDID